jgi:hypothetical protein
MKAHTEFLLDDLENLLVVKLAGNSLHSSQGFAAITLCSLLVSLSGCCVTHWAVGDSGRWRLTLDADMDVLLGLSSLSRVLVGFGEGVFNDCLVSDKGLLK